MTNGTRRRVGGCASLVAMACLIGATLSPAPASAFGSVCSAVNEPQSNPPCPVKDIPVEGSTGTQVDVENNKLDQDTKWDGSQQIHQKAVGPQGDTKQGQPQQGMDMQNGQPKSGSPGMAATLDQVVQFNFGPPQSTKSDTIGGATPSNFTAAAKDNSSSDIAATVLALQAKQQVQKDAQEVQQMVSQAKQTENQRQDDGMANKVRDKLAQELALKAALISWLLGIKAKRANFHLLNDQTPDSTDKAAQNATASLSTPSGSSSGATTSTAGSGSTSPTTSSGLPTNFQAGATPSVAPIQTIPTQQQASAAVDQAMTALQGAGASSAGALNTSSNSQTGQSLATARAAAAAAIAGDLNGVVASPPAVAETILASYDGGSGSGLDKVRAIALSLASSPGSYGLPAGYDATPLVDALSTYAAAAGG